MGYSQNRLGRRFKNGDHGTASNLEIKQLTNGGTILVGYGHAVYAYRSPDGHLTVFKGWYKKGGAGRHSGSQTTKSHFGKMGLLDDADELIEDTDIAPSPGDFDPQRWEKRREPEDPLLA